ncbi:hypothetical protein Tco_0791328 [Tanacetum coccineum]
MEKAIPFLCHRWIQDVEGVFDTSKCPKKLRVKFTANLLRGRAKEWWNYTLVAKDPDVARNFSWNEFKEARFLPKYINDQKFLMNHYVDMLRKEIRELSLSKDWKNMDKLMNAALEREQETKKRERSPPKRKIEQGGYSSKMFKSNETYPRAPPAPKPSGAPSLAGVERPQRPPIYPVYQNCLVKISLSPLDVEIANSKIIHVANVFQNCEIETDNEKFPINLIFMPMREIDVVVGTKD